MAQQPPSPPVLTYFPLPGRGEVARLLFTLGGVEFVDKRVPPADWPALKPSTPFGQIPTLTVGDVTFAQAPAIDRYAARVAGLLPDDPVAALRADQAYFFVLQDIHNALIAPTNRLPPEEQVAAREKVAAGPLPEKLALLSKLVESRPGKFIAGDHISHGDLAIFNHLSTLRSGALAGLPSNLLDSFPALRAFRHAIASEPAIAAFYAAATDDVRRAGYTPDAAAA